MPEPRDENEHASTPEEPWPIIRAQSRSFFKAPLCTDLEELDADVALIGVPFDQGTLGRPGARFGPDAIRDAPRSYSYSDPYGKRTHAEGFFDVDAQGRVRSVRPLEAPVPRDVQAFALTVEPAGGKPLPTGAIHLLSRS